MEIEVIKKTQTKWILETENQGKQAGSTDVSITNRMQVMEESISGVEDTREEINTLIKENANSKKILDIKLLENLRHYGKTKYKINRNRRRLSIPA